ncbi:chaplin [Streptomyces sp. YGL11-2]|uniref:chaplin n=1 Tax=Streptomyces sp. YGL11-2 TaxID=3414028 RepID=UPI003CF9FC88
MNTAKKAALVLATTGLALGAAAGSAFAHDGGQASGKADCSPGVLSGNVVQAPVSAPVNVSNNSVKVADVLSPVAGNSSVNR